MTIKNEGASIRPARQLNELPGPPGLPLLGNLVGLFPKRIHLQLEDWARRYGDLFIFHLGPKPVLVVAEVALVQQVLRERPKSFRRFTVMREVIDELHAAGLFTAEGETWRRQRRLVMTAFGASSLRAAHPAIAKITERLRHSWQRAAERGDSVDALRDLARYTVDVTSMVGLGVDLNTIENKTHELRRPLEAMLRAANRRINAPFPLWRYLKLPADYALDRSVAEVERVVLSLIAKAQVELAAEPARAAAPRNLLEALLSARDADDASMRLSDREVFGNVVTVLVAGEDTTANTLAWLLYFMALHPELQARLQAEVDEQFGESMTPSSPEDVQKLRYLTAMAHETLRLKSPVPVLSLESVDDTMLGEVHVPAGTAVLLLPRLLALNDHNYHHAAVFDPTRWLGPTAAGHEHEPRAALAFGAGPRVCPGRSLALLECGMVGAMVVRNFHVSLFSPTTVVNERSDFTMKPEGLRVRLTPRRGSHSDLLDGSRI